MSRVPDAPVLPPSFHVDGVHVLWLAGEDRLAFLERLSTQRLADLPVGDGRATVLLTDHGRVVDLVNVHAGEDGVALVTSGPLAAEAVTSHLRRYVLRDRVRVTDASGQVLVLRLLGPDPARLAAAATGLAIQPGTPGQWLRARFAGEELWALAHPEPGGAGGLDLVATRGPAAEGLVAALAAAGARQLDAPGYDAWRIAQRLPAYGHEIDGEANPLELGLRAVVDFAKGCYVGQEVVARLDSYDKVQRALVGLAAEQPLARGDLVGLDEAGLAAGRRRALGRVTTAAPDPQDPSEARWLALALVPAGWEAAPALWAASAGASAQVVRVTG